ncbi:MAG: hypothetical protein KDD01_00290 [Phaeodactylibacter sp.]|nr:hypothetical protein [Phaeodactylibacter sp.]
MIFCLLWISAHSSDTLVVDHSFQQIDILSVGSLYSTADADRNIGEVQQLPLSDWTPLSTTGTVLYSLDQVYWVKSTLKNEAQQIQSVYVEVGNKRINELQFFVRRDTGLFTSEVTGDYHPFYRRMIQHPSMICPVELGAGETVTVYINYIKTGETISLDTKLWEKKHFERISRRDSFLIAMFFGFTLCILLWPVFIALFLSAPLFRYFVIYIFACIAMAVICHWQEEEHRIRLKYEDDGIGFDTTAPASGIGFKNIQARASLLNGGFRFWSNGQGSRFSFWVERSGAV